MNFRNFQFILISLLSCLSGLSLLAQSQEDPGLGEVFSNYTVDLDVFGGGNFYYVIIENETGEVVERGIMDEQGIDRIILAPETSYRLVSFYAETLSFGSVDFSTPRSGRSFVIPQVTYLELFDLDDEDGDGLPNIHEDVAGTFVDSPDSDNDGFLDGAEVVNGLNPLDGFIQETGIIATGPTPSPAVDICAINNLAIVAMGQGGVAIFNVRNGVEPVRIAQVNTPGDARAVSCFGDFAVVADGSQGIAVVDYSDPAGAFISRQIRLNSAVNCVASRGNFAFAGLENGDIVMIDVLTGTELDRYEGISSTIQDLGIKEEFLYVLTVGSLHTIDLGSDLFQEIGVTNSPGSLGAGRFRLRLFVGSDFLYATHTSGYNIIDLFEPSEPTFREQITTSQFGWKQLVATGTGLAVGTVSPNSTRDGNHDVNLYDVGENNRDYSFVRTFTTPGLATAVEIYNALAYIADDSGGLQVLNFASIDTGSVAPTISVRHSGINGQAEEGKVLSVAVDASDDVQVRNVQFFVDGVVDSIDGNFPFETGLITPAITAGKREFSFYIIATDTGGNSTRSDTVTLELVPDATPPTVRRFTPPDGAVVGNLDAILVTFSEPIKTQSIGPTSVTVLSAGDDDTFGTADDTRIDPTAYQYQSATNSLLITLSDVPPALTRISIKPPLQDLAANVIQSVAHSTVRVFGFEDRDADGVPDDLEPVLGLDPDDPDTDGDGILDGDEDADNDGLSNTGEVVLEVDPLNPDTDDDGILDGDEDSDFDGLADGDELRNRTDPLDPDSDGDGIDDLAELQDGLDPLDSSSVYPIQVATPVVSYVNGIVGEPAPFINLMIASPSVSYLNGIVIAPDVQTTYSTASPVVSYMNGLVEGVPADQPVFYTSGTVSYENQ